MLLQSPDDGADLLAALPQAWESGDLVGGRIRGGHVIDVSWRDGLINSATVTTGRSDLFVLDIPAGYAYEITCNSNASRCEITPSIDRSAGRLRLAWGATAGVCCRIARVETWRVNYIARIN
jgi:alpha-L-fucosidase 2